MPTPTPVLRRALAPLVPLVLLAACADGVPTGPAAGPTLARGGHPPAAAPGGVSTVLTGLNSPKGLAFGPEGALYVAETGTGAITGPCIGSAGDGGGEACYSGTGSVTRLWKGRQERVATGLPSIASRQGDAVAGPHDVDFQGRGNMYVSIGLGADPAVRAQIGALGSTLGTLVRVQPNGKWRVEADVAAYEGASNPAGGPEDSNPYGVLAEPGRQFVTDAGGNSLLEVRSNGAVSLVATFPSMALPQLPFPFPITEAEAVPTGVARGPDGALYVSTLTGAPFLPGSAVVYRVTPGAAPTVYAGGFTAVTDLAFGRDGSLYVLQFASGLFLGGSGSVVRVAPGGARTTLIATLAQPTGIAVGPDGAVYVTNQGASVGGGEVLRIDQ
jgi:glucose/arabinose dehydrogenase